MESLIRPTANYAFQSVKATSITIMLDVDMERNADTTNDDIVPFPVILNKLNSTIDSTFDRKYSAEYANCRACSPPRSFISQISAGECLKDTKTSCKSISIGIYSASPSYVPIFASLQKCPSNLLSIVACSIILMLI